MGSARRYRTRAAATGSRIAGYLRRCIRIDTRTLTVFRVFVGLLVVADLLLRSRNFGLFYTESGVVPRSLAVEHAGSWTFSFYHLTTDSTLIAALFVCQGLIAVALIVGYRTRLATVLTFLFVVSLDHHNPFVLSYADTLFRLLLFWAIFLPLGERWSVDAAHRDRSPRPFVANVASALILGQMVYMYLTNGLIKSRSDVWTSGEAAPLVFGIDEMTFLLGDTMRQVPALLEYGGLLWFYMLVASPLLILLRGRARMALAGLFVGGHLSFALTVRIGAFAYVALAGVILFLQGQFWRDLVAVARRLGVDTDGLSRRTATFERHARRVPNPRPGGERFRRVRQRVHTASITFVVAALVVSATILGGAAGSAALDGTDARSLEDRVERSIVETLDSNPVVSTLYDGAGAFGVDQPIGWGVFAGPDPRTTDRYYVFPAETASGELVDVYNDRELTFDRPGQQLQKQHGTYRERFYMNSVRRGGFTNDVPYHLAEHLCATWGDGEDALVALEMYEVTEEITHDTVDAPEDRERSYSLRYRHGCGDHEAIEIASPPG